LTDLHIIIKASMIIEPAIYDDLTFTRMIVKKALDDRNFNQMTSTLKLRFFNFYVKLGMDIEDVLFTQKLLPYFSNLDYFSLNKEN